MKLISFGISDTGKSRSNNEDAFFSDSGSGLFIIADGMGGGRYGEVASQIAIETVKNVVEQNLSLIDAFFISGSPENRRQILSMLATALHHANENIYNESIKLKCPHKMGTTLTVFLAVKETGFMVHAGDSRLYLVRNDQVTQISTDHTITHDYAAKYGDSGGGIEQSMIGVLSKAVGINQFVEPEKVTFDILAQDRFLMCTDGLHNYFSKKNKPVFEKYLADSYFSRFEPDAYLKNVASKLVEFAYDNGADDNITLILIATVDTTDDEITGSRDMMNKFEVIRNAQLFKGLTYNELLKILDRTEIRSFNKYDVVFKDEAMTLEKELLILIAGQVSILRESKLLDIINPGEHLGVLSFMDDGAKTITALADKPSTFLVIKKSFLLSITKDYPEIGVKLLWEIAYSLSLDLRTLMNLMEKQ